MSSSSSEKGKNIAFTVIAFWLGVFSFIKRDDILGETLRNYNEVCQNFDQLSMDDWVRTNPSFIKYDESLGLFSWGNVMVCTGTQLFYELNKINASALSSITLELIGLPLLVTIILEVGRKDSSGPLKIPLAVWWLMQNFSMAIVFPLFWLPSYFFLRGNGSINPTRVFISLPMALPPLIITIMIFYLEPGNPTWASLAAFVSGPAICAIPVFSTSIRDPDDDTEEEEGENIVEGRKKKSRKLTALIYGVTGLVSLAVWLWLLFIMVIPTYGVLSSPKAIYNEVWVTASPVLKVKTLEVITLWLSGLLFVAYRNTQAAIEAFFLSLLFGPGAGLSMALAGVAVDDPADDSITRRTKPHVKKE